VRALRSQAERPLTGGARRPGIAGLAIGDPAETVNRRPEGGDCGSVHDCIAVCTIEQTPLMEARNMRDRAQKPRTHQRRDGALPCVRETGERPTNHVCGGGRAVHSPAGVSGVRPPRRPVKAQPQPEHKAQHEAAKPGGSQLGAKRAGRPHALAGKCGRGSSLCPPTSSRRATTGVYQGS
jgi:hypothetical protein